MRIALRGNPPPKSYEASLAIWDHTVLPAKRHKWKPPRLNPSQTSRYSIYVPWRDGRLSWPRWLVIYPVCIQVVIALGIEQLHDYNIEILTEEAEYNLFHNSCSENHCLRHIYTVNVKPGAMRLHTTGTILHFPLLNTILIRRILLSEPCTIIFRMCFSGLSYSVSQCVLNVLIFYTFFHCSACGFVMCLLSYLLTYLLNFVDRDQRVNHYSTPPPKQKVHRLKSSQTVSDAADEWRWDVHARTTSVWAWSSCYRLARLINAGRRAVDKFFDLGPPDRTRIISDGTVVNSAIARVPTAGYACSVEFIVERLDIIMLFSALTC